MLFITFLCSCLLLEIKSDDNISSFCDNDTCLLDDITKWINTNGLHRYLTEFDENNVNFNDLMILSDHDIKKIGDIWGMNIFDKNRFRKAVKKLQIKPPYLSVTNNIRDLLENLDNLAVNIQNEISELESKKDILSIKIEETQTRINNEFDAIINVINRRRSQLITELNEQKSIRMLKFNKYNNILSEYMDEILKTKSTILDHSVSNEGSKKSRQFTGTLSSTIDSSKIDKISRELNLDKHIGTNSFDNFEYTSNHVVHLQITKYIGQYGKLKLSETIVPPTIKLNGIFVHSIHIGIDLPSKENPKKMLRIIEMKSNITDNWYEVKRFRYNDETPNGFEITNLTSNTIYSVRCYLITANGKSNLSNTLSLTTKRESKLGVIKYQSKSNQLCIDIENGAKHGNRARIFNCHNNRFNQLFYYNRDTKQIRIGTVSGRGGRYCLKKMNALIISDKCRNTNEYKFTIMDNKIKSFNGQCFHAQNKNGALITVIDCARTSSQIFFVSPF